MRKQRQSRAEQVEQNRGAVLAAARRVFLAKGYAGATVEAIADEAGFSKGVVYSQFGGKADMFLALLNSRIDERAAENERIAAELAGEEGMAALLANFERDSRTETGWSRVLLEFRTVALRDRELNRRYAEAHERTLIALAGLIERLHARAGLEPAVSTRTMAEFVLAIGAGLTLERAADPGALPTVELTVMARRALGLTAPEREPAPARAEEAVS
jgi:AcrR family transcriptional regulator